VNGAIFEDLVGPLAVGDSEGYLDCVFLVAWPVGSYEMCRDGGIIVGLLEVCCTVVGTLEDGTGILAVGKDDGKNVDLIG